MNSLATRSYNALACASVLASPINQVAPNLSRIAPAEVKRHPLSFLDPSGSLFWCNGQLLRGISHSQAELYRRLFRAGVVASLVEKKLLIETELTPHALDPYDLVLRHRVVPFVSYAFEWCGEMLRDSALTLLDLLGELARHDLTLQDAHPWNVLFDGDSPRVVDFGSIRTLPAAEPWAAHDEFLRYFLHPLQLMAAGHGRAARAFLFDWDRGVQPAEFVALSRPTAAPQSKEKRMLWWRHRSAIRPAPLFAAPPVPASFPNRAAYAEAMRKEVEAVPLPKTPSAWSGYYDACFPPFTPSTTWISKHRVNHQLLSELKPETVLDIGSNRGWYAQLAACLGAKVVAFDVDEACVTRLYADAKQSKFDILPLVMSFQKPTPGYGLGQWFPSAIERLRCDLVLALGLVHHLVFLHGLRFEQIVSGLADFSKQSLIVEFAPREDQHVAKWDATGKDWYTLENFKSALAHRFKTIRPLPLDPPRIILLCQK